MTKRDFAGQHFVEHDPQRVDVGSVVELMRAFHLFRCHVAWRAHHLMRTGQRAIFRRTGRQLGQPEVGNLHSTFSVEQDVLRLDVAMDNAIVMSELQGLADLRDNGQRLLWLEFLRFGRKRPRLELPTHTHWWRKASPRGQPAPTWLAGTFRTRGWLMSIRACARLDLPPFMHDYDFIRYFRISSGRFQDDRQV